MHVVHHAHLACRHADGQRQLVAAGPEQGITAFEVWLGTLEPGATTAELRHGGQLVVVAQQGSGKLLIDGGPQRFQAPCSLLVPAGRLFRIANNGSTALQLVWVCTEAPRSSRPSPEGGGPSPDGPWLLQPMRGNEAKGTLPNMPQHETAVPHKPIDEDHP